MFIVTKPNNLSKSLMLRETKSSLTIFIKSFTLKQNWEKICNRNVIRTILLQLVKSFPIPHL